MAITNFDNVELLLPMTGANNGTTFTDYSLRQRTVTRTGAVTSTAQSKFSAYGSSGYFDGTSDYLVPGTAVVPVSGDMTIAAWIRVPSIDATIQRTVAGQKTAAQNNTGRINFAVDSQAQNGKLLFFIGAGTSLALRSTSSVSTNEWVHVAASRASNIFRVFINGVLEGTSSEFTTSIENAETRIGMYNDGTNNSFLGYMQDLIIANNAIWTTTFTPPARMTQRTLTRTNTGTDSHEYDRAVLLDWNAPGYTAVGAVAPDESGSFQATNLIDIEYCVTFIKSGYTPICRGPFSVDEDV